MQETPTPQGSEQPVRIEDILANRIQSMPETTPQLSTPVLIIVVIGLILLGIILAVINTKPEVFAESEHREIHGSQHSMDAVQEKHRAELTSIIDTLTKHIVAYPNDLDAKLTLANAYYDLEMWVKAVPLYKDYLDKFPKNTNARVDYAYVIAQSSGDFQAAMSEIETALRYEPDHFNALFNGGLIALRAYENDRVKAFMTAGNYFKRAQEIARKNNNTEALNQIQQILDEMKKVVEESSQQSPK